jgi:hypothetical protein
MWQNWDFLQNNPYMFIVTTIVMGIILFIGAGTIAAGVDSVAKKSSNNSLLPISVYSLIGVAIAVLGSVFAPVSMIYLIIGIILEIAIMLVGPISIIKGQGNKKEVE